MRTFILSALALALTTATAAAQFGTIKGQIALQGDPPKPVKLDVNKDQGHCLAKGPIFSEKWIVDPKSKGLKDVVIWVAVDNGGKANHKGVLKVNQASPRAAVPKNPLVIDQPCCKFEPHLSVLRVGQDLLVKNSAPIPHNSLIQGLNGVSINPLIPAGGSVNVAAGKWNAHYLPSSISCSIHMWMSAKLFVFDHPHYAVTDKDGNFEIKDVPEGKLRLLIWHEEAGWVVKEAKEGAKGSDGKGITVRANGTLDLGKIEVKPE